MTRTKMVDGVKTPLTAAEETKRDAQEAEWAAGQAARDATASNAPILEQISVLEVAGLRSLRELSREQEFPGDLTPDDKAFAQNKIRQIDRDIETLRVSLQ